MPGRMSQCRTVEQELLVKTVNRLDEALGRLEKLEDMLKRALPPKPRPALKTESAAAAESL